MTTYQQMIADMTKGVDPRHVEAWMRLEHPTLDGLDLIGFKKAAYAAADAAIDAGAAESEVLAQSFGL